MSTDSHRVRRCVEDTGRGTFVRVAALSRASGVARGDTRAEVCRLVERGELVRVSEDVLYRPPRCGDPAPPPVAAAVASAGVGAGPAGDAAAVLLGVADTAPTAATANRNAAVAVPGPPPRCVAAVDLVVRPRWRRWLRLSPWEVAVLEVLHHATAGGDGIPGIRLALAVRALVADRRVRIGRLRAAVAVELPPHARGCWRDLRREAATLPPPCGALAPTT